MKFLILTEGAAEEALVETLIDKGLTIFTWDDLLDQRTFPNRNIHPNDDIADLIYSLKNNEEVCVYRIIDKDNANFEIPKELKDNIKHFYNICTKPEIEILFIINDGYYKEYLKCKSDFSPSSFYKSMNKKYKKGKQFALNYFSNLEPQVLKKLILLYTQKRGKVHGLNEQSFSKILK